MKVVAPPRIISYRPNNTKGKERRHDDCAINLKDCQELFRNKIQHHRRFKNQVKIAVTELFRYMLGTFVDFPHEDFLKTIRERF